MPGIPSIPADAPFSSEQRFWLNGFLAGLFSMSGDSALPSSAAPALLGPPKPLLVLFGSQTGTAETLAKKTSKEAIKLGFAARALEMDKSLEVDFAKEENLLVITSTYGDGEPPDNAQAFWNFLKADSAPQLSHLKYSVLALGDTNYQGFCQFGKDCDTRLAQLGAQRIHNRIDCDLDYEAPAKNWSSGVFAALSSAPIVEEAEAPAQLEPLGSKKNPYPARLLTNRLLNGIGSAKEVRHFEISLAACEVPYEVGDALGVHAANCPDLVQDLIAALGCDGEEAVFAPDGTETSLRRALLENYDITKPSPDFLTYIALHQPELAALLAPDGKDALRKYLWGREIVDFITKPLPLGEFIPLLKKMTPRLYSISSSPKAHPGEVHLTISAVRHESHGRLRKGVCSTFLADRCSETTSIPVFIQTSHGFRVPEDLSRPIIMVGPGTGIAPFRAFLEERKATNASGKNWLFFGDQKRSSDYLYEDELTALQAEGYLHRLDLAFSRDQEEKIYVQTRMIEAGAEIWEWLEAGAHFYVCGDATRMAKDVDNALHTIVETVGGRGKDGAKEYMAQLKADKRYQRDVY